MFVLNQDVSADSVSIEVDTNPQKIQSIKDVHEPEEDKELIHSFFANLTNE